MKRAYGIARCVIWSFWSLYALYGAVFMPWPIPPRLAWLAAACAFITRSDFAVDDAEEEVDE